LGLALFAGVSAIAVAQQPTRPLDVDAESLSRFPIVGRSQMKTDADRVAYDYIVGTAARQVPLRGPGGVSLHSPGSAEPIERLNRYLRNESVIGRRLFELCAIIGAWEIEQQYEWSGHEAAALQFGVSQKAVHGEFRNSRGNGSLKQPSTVFLPPVRAHAYRRRRLIALRFRQTPS
jgi:hypothetical protein